MSCLHRISRLPPRAAALALAAISLGILFAAPAGAQSAGCKSEDPIYFDSELAQNCGTGPYIPDWQHDMDKPIDPTEIGDGETELNALLNEPPTPPPANFTAWYSKLDEQDKQRLLSYMAKQGITDENGNALSEADFAAYLPFFDSEIRKQAKTDQQRAAAFLEIENETGIMPSVSDADLDGLGDFGLTGSTGPRSDLDTGH